MISWNTGMAAHKVTPHPAHPGDRTCPPEKTQVFGENYYKISTEVIYIFIDY
jgi:hypothetical protein